MKRGCVFKKLDYVLITRNGTHRRSIKLVRPGNPAEHMGHVYGPWRMPRPRTRHSYTHMHADEWFRLVSQLQLLDASTGQVWTVPHQGSLIVDFQCVPRCATPIEALNGTGLKRLIRMLVNHRECTSDLLRVCSSLVSRPISQLAIRQTHGLNTVLITNCPELPASLMSA
jgi:hypothetical protein